MSLKDRFHDLGRRLRADRKGSAAIEFAFVAPIFFALLLGIFEGALMFFSQAVLQNAVTIVGRTLRTGQAACNTTNNGACVAMTADGFRSQVCSRTGPLLPGCDSAGGLSVSSTRYVGGFGGAGATPVTGGGNGFTGGPCDVMVVRASYAWNVVTPGITWFLVNTTDGKHHLLVSTVAFRNEPYGGAPC